METEKNPQRTQEKWHTYKIVCLFMLSGYWYLATYNSDQTQFTALDLLATASLLLVALLVQVGLLLLARRRSVVLDLLAGFFAVVNLGVLYLSFVLPFHYFEWYMQIILFASTWLFATLFFTSFANGRNWRRLLIGAAFALFAFQAAVAASYLLRNFFHRFQLFSEQTVRAENMTSSPNVRLVEFAQTPNVYIFGFDGMLPEALAQELIDIPSLPYARTLEENGFLFLSNYFADSWDTKTTFASVFSVEPRYDALFKTHGQNTGQKPSPLREIFRFNGYKTHLYTDAIRLGYKEKGVGWDDYEIANLTTNACFHMDNKPVFAHYGYCYFLDIVHDSGYIEFGHWEDQRYIDFLLDAFAKKLEKGGRHLFVSYLRLPEHANTFYILTNEDLAEFRETYRQGSETTALAMEEIFNFVGENDPDAWLFFFSDHGTLMYGPERDDDEAVGRRTRVLDNYGGLVAFYPPQACQEYFAQRQWSTTSMLTRDILRCLAGGVDPLVNDVTYQFVEEGVDLTDYFYE